MPTPAEREQMEKDAALRAQVGLERYAEILAHAIHFRGEDLYDIARRFGLTPEQWARLDASWTDELSRAHRQQHFDRGVRFTGTFAAVKKRLEATMPAWSSIRPPPAHAPRAADPPSPEPAPPPPPVVPFAWSQPVAAPPPVVATAPPSLDATADVTALRPPVSLPFIKPREGEPRPAAAPAPPASPPPPREAGDLDATADVSALRPRDLLPFAKASPPAAPEPAPPEVSPSAGITGSLLTVAQYAALWVHLDQEPHRREELLRFYRVDDAQDARWRAALATDPDLRRSWEDACRTYRDWLSRQRPGP